MVSQNKAGYVTRYEGVTSTTPGYHQASPLWGTFMPCVFRGLIPLRVDQRVIEGELGASRDLRTMPRRIWLV